MQTMQVAVSIIGIILVIVAAYYVTYFIGVKSSGVGRRGRNRNRNIRMLDRFSISKDKSFCIVEIAGKVYVVGVTNQSMSLLDTLDAEAFAQTEAKKTGAAAWQGRSAAWQTATGGTYIERLTRKLALFIAKRIGKNRVAPAAGGEPAATATATATFEEAMRAARGEERGERREG